jgi:hypothetical protein
MHHCMQACMHDFLIDLRKRNLPMTQQGLVTAYELMNSTRDGFSCDRRAHGCGHSKRLWTWSHDGPSQARDTSGNALAVSGLSCLLTATATHTPLSISVDRCHARAPAMPSLERFHTLFAHATRPTRGCIARVAMSSVVTGKPCPDQSRLLSTVALFCSLQHTT